MTTANITRELTFEDMSVHSPGAFRKGDAMRQLRTAPTASAFREALKELDQTANSLDALVEGAKEKALGNSEADLDRIKNNVKRLKFGTIELGTEAAFLRSVLESRPLPSARAPPRESAEFKAASAEIKLLKDRNDAEAKEVAKLVQEVGQSAVAFQQMRDALATRVVQLDELESAAEAAEMAASGADAPARDGPVQFERPRRENEGSGGIVPGEKTRIGGDDDFVATVLGVVGVSAVAYWLAG